jgi:hypothetical protein
MEKVAAVTIALLGIEEKSKAISPRRRPWCAVNPAKR